MRRWMTCWTSLLAFAVLCPAADLDRDSDGDGLSDFAEIHKYLTDPHKADSDGDGVPDGDWQERREYAYTLRTILRIMPPLDEAALSDDYQDARVLKKQDDYIELEVVHYPLSSAEATIEANPNWRRDDAGMKEWLEPGITTNWDAQMRKDVLAELDAADIHVDRLSDKEVVEKVSRWALKRGRYLDRVFTTYYIDFAGGRPVVPPELERAYRDEFARAADKYDWPIERHFDHEILGRGMFYNKTYGSCTSTAIYLTTVLRAAGIPARMIVVIPAIDPSDPNQVKQVEEHVSHHGVRQVMLDWAEDQSGGFTAHTFNEVYVGGRWRRLNYNRLGQPSLYRHLFGLSTHVYTFKDLSAAGLARTWGRRYAEGARSAIFKTSNPYATVAVTDLFGQHGHVANPPVEGKPTYTTLTVTRALWFHSAGRPAEIPDSDVAVDDAGHLLLHVEEHRDGVNCTEQYAAFNKRVDKRFTLKAAGQPDVSAQAERGFWGQEFYVRIPADQYARMAPGVAYTLHPSNAKPPYRWQIAEGVVVRKPAK